VAPVSILAPSPTYTPQRASAETAETLTADLAGAANQIYQQKSCVACHGANYEGGLGPILVGLPTHYFQSVTRSGEPEAGMPAFDQNAISDDDLSTLAEFLSSLTLQDIDVNLSPVVVGHLSQAWDALQAGDKATVQTNLDKAHGAGADAPPGVQATLKALAGGLEGADWVEDTKARLEVLLGR
jgi:cytochrome c553